MVSMDVTLNGVSNTVQTINTIKSGLTASGNGWVVGVGVDYGAYVEFGTSRMAAQPYLFPAARQAMRSDFRGIERNANTLDEVVEGVALAIERRAKQNAPVDTGALRASISAAPAGQF